MPAAGVIAPLSFIAANESIYWSGWTTLWKLYVAIVIGFVLFAIYRAVQSSRKGIPPGAKDLQLRSRGWILPWLVGIGIISAFGQYDAAVTVIPEWWDLILVAAWSLVIHYLAVRMVMPTMRGHGVTSLRVRIATTLPLQTRTRTFPSTRQFIGKHFPTRVRT